MTPAIPPSPLAGRAAPLARGACPGCEARMPLPSVRLRHRVMVVLASASASREAQDAPVAGARRHSAAQDEHPRWRHARLPSEERAARRAVSASRTGRWGPTRADGAGVRCRIDAFGAATALSEARGVQARRRMRASPGAERACRLRGAGSPARAWRNQVGQAASASSSRQLRGMCGQSASASSGPSRSSASLVRCVTRIAACATSRSR